MDYRTAGRLGAHTMHATHDSRVTSANGRAAFASSFERQVREKYPTLPDAEVMRRADHLRKAHYVRISALGVAARRKAASK